MYEIWQVPESPCKNFFLATKDKISNTGMRTTHYKVLMLLIPYMLVFCMLRINDMFLASFIFNGCGAICSITCDYKIAFAFMKH